MAIGLLGVTAFAHERDEHDKDINRVLFGVDDYKSGHEKTADVIRALEDAAYLAVDQYNHHGQDALDNLNSRKIPGIPSSIEDIDFTGNYAHRNFTHRGWNIQYPEKSHWSMRRTILMNTVEHELFVDSDTPLSWFPWASEKVYGRRGTEKQQESFCVLLYYTHIIGDHIEAKKFQDLAYVAPLIRPDDRDNPGIIPELISCIEVLFEDQKHTFLYSGLIQELQNLQYKSEKLVRSDGGINNDQKFEEYHECAVKLLDVLKTYIPDLLKNEEFFYSKFYK